MFESKRLSRIGRELLIFAIAAFVMRAGTSIVEATLNNFLNDRFSLTGFQRSFLEFPRELPGFCVVFVSAMLAFLCSRRLGTLAVAVACVGVFLLGFASPTYLAVVITLFIFSLGQHLYMPVFSTIGMELAEPGKTGKRLGQLNSLRNLAAIVGSSIVFLGFKYLHFSYHTTFAIAGVSLILGTILMMAMTPEKDHQPKTYMKIHRRYTLYYVLSVLFGSRKQLFITFAPWVLVTVFEQPTQTIATLLTIGGVIGIAFQPLLGWTIDRFGERFVLVSEAVLLVFVCFGYGFARFLFSPSTAFWVTCGCFLLDQMVISVAMARAMYIKKIAVQPADVQPALAAGVTIDHFFSIFIAILGGWIWTKFGYQYVFLMGVVIAIVNFFAAMKIRITEHHAQVSPSGDTAGGTFHEKDYSHRLRRKR